MQVDAIHKGGAFVSTNNNQLSHSTFIAIKLSTFGAAISIADMRMNSHPRTAMIP